MKYSIRYRLARLAKQMGTQSKPQECEALLDMQKEIAALPDGIQFSITRDASGNWVAESVNIDGILTGGGPNDKTDDMIKDAIFTYYGIPPKYCDNTLLRNANEPVVTKQTVYATA